MLTKLWLRIKLYLLHSRLNRLLQESLIPPDFDLNKSFEMNSDMVRNAQLSYLFANQFLTANRNYSNIKFDKAKQMLVPLNGVALESFMKIMDALSTTIGKNEANVLALNDYIVAYGIKEITRILYQDKTFWFTGSLYNPINTLHEDYKKRYAELI